MSTGKYLSLEEARKKNQLDRFAKAHPSKGNKKRFLELLKNMTLGTPVKKPVKGGKTSRKG
jgi:hypothetical protein